MSDRVWLHCGPGRRVAVRRATAAEATAALYDLLIAAARQPAIIGGQTIHVWQGIVREGRAPELVPWFSVAGGAV